ncbi:MAG: NapC/NirT family cytochrome c [Kofleriaceae bacterium]
MRLDVFTVVALAGAAGAALILLWYLLARPPLNRLTKLALLAGIGVLPIVTAGSGNYAGFEATKRRSFCGSCHVMTPYLDDVEDPTSMGLAAIHTRNAQFGEESCYTCHADYGMFGTVVTKAGGLRHVYYYLTEYHAMTLEESRASIHLRGTFKSSTCRRCHSTTAPGWSAVGDHAALLDELRAGKVGCVGDGCHGPAHPWSKEQP